MAFKSSFTLLLLTLSTICDTKSLQKRDVNHLISFKRQHCRPSSGSVGVNTLIDISCTSANCTFTWSGNTTNSAGEESLIGTNICKGKYA